MRENDRLCLYQALMLKFGWNSTLGQTIRGHKIWGPVLKVDEIHPRFSIWVCREPAAGALHELLSPWNAATGRQSASVAGAVQQPGLVSEHRSATLDTWPPSKCQSGFLPAPFSSHQCSFARGLWAFPDASSGLQAMLEASSSSQRICTL